MSESLSHDLREAWRKLRAENPAMAALCLESAGALEKSDTEVRRLRAESTDVFECADGTVAKDATVAAQTWADECRRLQAREAKAREILQAHVAEYVRTDTDEGVARAAERVAIWMDAARWLAEGE